MKNKIILIIFLLFLSSHLYSQSYTDFITDDINGVEIKLESFVSKGPVMLGFWRSWCSSCKEEQRNMQILFEKYNFDYIVINPRGLEYLEWEFIPEELVADFIGTPGYLGKIKLKDKLLLSDNRKGKKHSSYTFGL
ncbi:MAG: redoxin domain-containing protein [Ignavibacteriae bacterium]|nr:redoxin domain-containing protein [Ignavibacteriota bacterium]